MITIKIRIIGTIDSIAWLLNSTFFIFLNEKVFIMFPTAVFFTTISFLANTSSIWYLLLKSSVDTLSLDVSATKCTPPISKSISWSTDDVPSFNSNAGSLFKIKFFHPPTLTVNPATSIPYPRIVVINVIAARNKITFPFARLRSLLYWLGFKQAILNCSNQLIFSDLSINDYSPYTILFSNSSFSFVPLMISTNLAAKSIAVPIPRLVMIFPSTTTLSVW